MPNDFSPESTAAIGFLAGVGTVYLVIGLVIIILLIIANWKIFTKAGEAGWASLIPIYSVYVLFRIIYGNGWKFLFLLIPILNVIVSLAMMIRLAQAFGKGIGFGLGLIFLPNIFTLILGFGSAQYEGSVDAFV